MAARPGLFGHGPAAGCLPLARRKRGPQWRASWKPLGSFDDSWLSKPPARMRRCFAADGAFSLSGGSYDLYYAEVNGLPAELNLDLTCISPIPEPASMALVGAGLFGVGLLRRERQA